MAVAYYDYAAVATPEGTIRMEPLDDCRTVAVSPDGEWLATGTHDPNNGAHDLANPRRHAGHGSTG